MKLHIFGLAMLACTARSGSPPAAAEIVFVCEHGAAKSVVASQYFNKLAAERGLAVRSIARGADPQAELSVSAVKGLKEDGLPSVSEGPRPLTASEVRSSARVIAFDCDQPAMKTFRGLDACWDDVPATGDDYARARDRIRAHVEEMVEQIAARGELRGGAAAGREDALRQLPSHEPP